MVRPSIALLSVAFLLGCTSGQVVVGDESADQAALVHAQLDTAHPNVVEVLSVVSPTRLYVCTGTLIASHTVLTAAHCIVSHADDMSAVVDPYHKFQVLAFARHPDY